MSEESTAHDLIERWRRSFRAITGGDVDAALGVLGPGAVWDLSPMGLGVYEGRTATRRFFEDWLASYEEYEIEPEEILDIGEGVTFAVIVQQGRLAGSDGFVRLRYAAVAVWADGLIVRITNYGDPDEARAAAEALAESRR